MALPTPTKAKVASQFYQYSFGDRGFVSIYKPAARSEQGWKFVVCEYEGWDRTRPHHERMTEIGYKTMKEALEAASYYLMSSEEKEEDNAIHRAESERVLAKLTAQIAKNEVIFADLRARGLIK